MRTSHKAFTTFNLIGSGALIALSFDLPETIIRFLLVGELPDGTTLLSPDAMLVITILGFVGTLILITPSIYLRSLNGAIDLSPKLRLPRRRYTSIQ